MIEAYLAGQRRQDLATRFAIHPTTVDAILTRAGISPRPPTGMSEHDITDAVRLYLQHRMSCAQIARRLGYDPKTIWKALRRSGVRLRDTAGLDQ